MKLSALFDMATLDRDVEGGLVRMQTHPDHPHLGILNYTEKAQFDNHWDAVTLRSRGLVFDGLTEEVVALPFPKFFNYDQHGPSSAFGELPGGPFEVFDKMDGSLGIFFSYDGHWLTATRGSFASDQAQWAQGWIGDHITNGDGQFLDPDITYLAEIIYPQNRIVVDYKGLEDCVLLGGYNRETGREVDLYHLRQEWPGPSVRPMRRFATLAALATEASESVVKGTDQEGYVVRFKENGQRTKLKFTDYKNIHGLFTETNEKTLWAILAGGGAIGDLAEQIPDELYAWCREVADNLNHQHDELVQAVTDARHGVMAAVLKTEEGYTRKGFALTAQRMLKPHILKGVFMVLDGNHGKLAEWAWRQLEPANGGRRP